jgi:hypothetical protein
MSYKKANTRPLPTATSSYYYTKLYSSKLLLGLARLELELIFIYEYSINRGIVKQYTWGPKANSDYIIVQPSTLSITHIAAIDKNDLLMLHAKTGTNRAK